MTMSKRALGSQSRRYGICLALGDRVIGDQSRQCLANSVGGSLKPFFDETLLALLGGGALFLSYGCRSCGDDRSGNETSQRSGDCGGGDERFLHDGLLVASL